MTGSRATPLFGSRRFPQLAPPADPGGWVHGPFLPGDVRPGEEISAQVEVLRVGGMPRRYLCPVWRMSPLGLELIPASGVRLEPGTELRLRLKLGRQTSELTGLVVTSDAGERGRPSIAVRLFPAPSPPAPRPNQREGRRWPCGDEFLPTGIAPNPIRFNDFLHFRVSDVSRRGMRLITSLRNRFVVAGMTLDATVMFPGVGQAQLACRIVHTEPWAERGKEYLCLGVELGETSPSVLKVMGQYLLQVGSPGSLQELRASGLEVQSTTRALTFSFVRTPDEYRQVLALRQQAYAQAQKVPVDLPPEAMGDRFDGRARLLIGTYRGEVIASLRLIFPEPDEGMDHEQHVALPATLPPRSQIVEVSRVCTHPAHRGSDLLLGLFRHAALAVLQAKRAYVLGSATDKLLPFYLRLGFKSTGVRFTTQTFGPEAHEIFLGDVASALAGKGISPLVWNAIFRDLWGFLPVHARQRADDPLMHARLAVYRLFGPLTELLLLRRAGRRRSA